MINIKLKDWINYKATELKVDKKYREVKFLEANECKIAKNIHQTEFLAKDIHLDTKVEEVDNNKLTNEYVKGVDVIFEFIKPRKRKYELEEYTLLIK